MPFIRSRAALPRLGRQAAAEDLAQMFRNLTPAFMGNAVFEDLREFTLVEPESVASDAPVIHYGRITVRDGFRHLLAADRTTPAFLGDASVRRPAVQERIAALGVAEQQFEFARVQPDAFAGETVVHLDALILEDRQRLFACGTVHDLRALLQYGPPARRKRILGVSAREIKTLKPVHAVLAAS
jgi:hypothetical protein